MNRLNIRFASAEHRDFFLRMMSEARKNDCYHQSFFYVMGIAPETRANIRQMFDFKQDCIKPEGMHGGWQTSGTVRVCRLAFNLWNGYTEPEHSNAYSPEDLFSDLCKYASEDFYREHKTICFDTLDSFGEYEVIAAFKTVAYSGEGFKYYHFVNAESAEAFDEYIAECKALALYDTGVTAEYGDKLITLSTCEYSRTNGRMVVVAKLLDA